MQFDEEARRGALWSTEAAAAMGLSDRTTKAQLWARKRGLSEPEDASDNVSARLGLACQSGVIQMHREDTGHELLSLDDLELRRDVQGVRMGSHYDALNKTLSRLHEVKFFALHRMKEFGEPGSDNVPFDVLVQVLHGMTVFNADKTGYGTVDATEINVVFGNVHRAVFVIPYDLEARDKLLQREAAFQALVDAGTPPEPQSPEDARIVWARTDGSEMIADRITEQAHSALVGLRKQLKSLGAQEKAIELHIQSAMQAASVLKSPDGSVLATWKEVSAERVDVKRFRAEQPQLAAAYLNTSASRRFLVKG